MTDEKPVYTEADIRKLNPMEHIRLRPGMYIGGTDKNTLHHLFHEILDEAIYEAKTGYCDHIWITMRPNYELSIRDNGRGIPVNMTRHGKNMLELLMTQVFVGRPPPQYSVTGGLHGVGIIAVNALCSEFIVEVARDGFLWKQTYREGVPRAEVLQVRPLADDELTGTHITIRPDFTILETNDFDYEILADRAREVAYLLPTLTITLRDERENVASEDKFHFPSGLPNYITHLNQPSSVVHSPFTAKLECKIQSNNRDTHAVRVDVAFQYNATMESNIVGYVNTVRTAGGYHTDIIPPTLTNVINRRADDPFSIAEIMPGLTAIVSVWHPYPAFESQTNIKFILHEISGMVAVAIEAAIPTYTDDNIKQLIQKLLANRESLKS